MVFFRLLGWFACFLLATTAIRAQQMPTSIPTGLPRSFEGAPTVSSEVALTALASLSDLHLLKLAEDLEQAGVTDSAASLDWQKIRPLLEQVSNHNVAAVHWFALPDGRYWTLEQGLSNERLSDRPYFPRLLAGSRVLGELVVSRTTGRSSAIVAVPITGRNGLITGVLGASVDLEKLTERLGLELGVDSTMIYYSFDSRPLLGLVWDPTLTLVDPHLLGREVGEAFDRMKQRNEGVETYSFRGKERTVVFRRSDVTGWWYAFGIVK